jgi:hypothetical protein
MSATADRIRRNLDQVRATIAGAAERSGRRPEAVRLVAVTKAVSPEEAAVLVEGGVSDLGENRLEHAQSLMQRLSGVRWHMIGQVQRRKARDVAARFDVVHSVDRTRLAEALDARCAEAGRRLKVFLEVNVSGEEAKAGMAPEELPAVLEAVSALEHLSVEGLMTMAPLMKDPAAARPVFAALRELAERHKLPGLSMGMSNDYQVAVEEGATEVRIGTALFKESPDAA